MEFFLTPVTAAQNVRKSQQNLPSQEMVHLVECAAITGSR